MYSKIEQVIEKRCREANADVDYHIERLLSYPENEWFKPNNNKGDDFTIFQFLFEISVVEKKISPNWNGELFRGFSIWFKYKKELNY